MISVKGDILFVTRECWRTTRTKGFEPNQLTFTRMSYIIFYKTLLTKTTRILAFIKPNKANSFANWVPLSCYVFFYLGKLDSIYYIVTQ